MFSVFISHLCFSITASIFVAVPIAGVRLSHHPVGGFLA